MKEVEKIKEREERREILKRSLVLKAPTKLSDTQVKDVNYDGLVALQTGG